MQFRYNEHSLKPEIYKILNTHTNRVHKGWKLSPAKLEE